MLTIRRTARRHGTTRPKYTRGPYLTDSTQRDGSAVAPIVLELHPTHLAIRLRGRRNAMSVPYTALYALAARLEAEQHRRERMHARALKRCTA